MDKVPLTAQFDPAVIGAALAHQDADVQSQCVNAFFAELLHTCETRYYAQKQCGYIEDKLSVQVRDVLELPSKGDDDAS